MESITDALIQQVPGMVALIVVVVIFVRHLESRDKAFMAMLAKLTSQVKQLDDEQAEHHTITLAAIAEMRRTVAKRDKPTQPAQPATDSP